MNIDHELFDAYKCPTPEQAMAMIPLVGACIVSAMRKGEFDELLVKWNVEADRNAPSGTRARLFANMIWNSAMEQASTVKVIFKCRACHQKNRALLSRRGVCGVCKQPLYPQDIIELSRAHYEQAAG